MWYNKLIKEICGLLFCLLDRVIEIQITFRRAGALFKRTFTIFMSTKTDHNGITKWFFRFLFGGWFKNQTLEFFDAFYLFVIVRINAESHEICILSFRDDIYGCVMSKIAIDFRIYKGSLGVHEINSWRRAIFWRRSRRRTVLWRRLQGVFYNCLFLPFYYHFRDICWHYAVLSNLWDIRWHSAVLPNLRDICWHYSVLPDRRILKYSFLILAIFSGQNVSAFFVLFRTFFCLQPIHVVLFNFFIASFLAKFKWWAQLVHLSLSHLFHLFLLYFVHNACFIT